MEDYSYCIADLAGRKRCRCPMCRNELKIRRANNLIVWGSIVAFFLVAGLGIFSARSADCYRGNCWGSCIVGTACGTGPGCGCVPTMPNSPLGTCVGGG